MNLAKKIIVCLFIAILCNVGGVRGFSLVEKKGEYCIKLKATVEELGKRFTDTWNVFEDALHKVENVKENCERFVKLSEEKEVSDAANSDKMKLVNEYYNAIMYNERQISDYEKKIHDLLIGLGKHCGFWLSFTPVSSFLRDITKRHLEEASELISKVESLSENAKSYASHASGEWCSAPATDTQEEVTRSEAEPQSGGDSLQDTTPTVGTRELDRATSTTSSETREEHAGTESAN
ncbi:Enriched in surface-labeled proteome protein 17 [Trypanosoma brucei equiperdum]|uniref:Enriched in surface-labeled proteome protein 17 n=1 Tax=Trypanosoma brucei equiperdum TaxID=630700 RepID=A0A3L6L3S0_9TRYP|nr:Enriched in surface-labeled proteome protein 17 [Trypanosoma brucei equiperdum]